MPDGGRATRTARESAVGQAATAKLRQVLGDLAYVRAPGEAEEPILAPMVRLALFQWMQELNAAEDLAAVRVKPRNSVLLVGPPGTGKTTLAHHIAARRGIPLVVVGPDTIVGKYLGDSARNASALFANLKQAETPCIVFMDEIDALGSSRDSHGDGLCSQELTSMLTVLLRKVEEFDGLLIAATNRPDSIDKALWRRFGMHLSIDLPGEPERFAILKRYASPFEMTDESFDLLTTLTEGASPALLRNLMEGMKRAMIINPRIRVATDNPRKVFLSVIASIEPPPGMTKPPLWEDQKSIHELANLDWPPTLPSKE